MLEVSDKITCIIKNLHDFKCLMYFRLVVIKLFGRIILSTIWEIHMLQNRFSSSVFGKRIKDSQLS